MREMTETERERITAEIAADPDQLADLMADRMPLAIRRWIAETSIQNAVAKMPDAEGRDEIVEALRRTLLHPSASDNLDTAISIFKSQLPIDTAAKALDALAGSGGGRSAN